MTASAEKYDLIVVGAGLAGGAFALAMAESPLKIAVIDAQPERRGWPPLDESVLDYDARVSALTEVSRTFLDRLGVWSAISERRACAYRDMQVWDAEGTGEIHFSADDVGQSALGHIVENRLITAALINKLRETSVRLMFNTPVAAWQAVGDGGELQLEDGRVLRAPLIVAADGANSRMRQWGGFQTREWDYHHHAIVCTVETERPHRATAWQRFLPQGPLAFLPLPDRDRSQHYSSIVWSATPDFAETLMAMDDSEFNAALARHFEYRLGAVIATSRRVRFPLRQRHAVQYSRQGIVLLGDAAHTIHPLAGQGINLGFGDAQVLAQECQRALARGLSLADSGVLARYQRRRKGENLAMMAAMQGFQNLFESDAAPLRMLRNVGMRWLDKAVPLKRQVIARAMGLGR
ncbi:FAD-dependent monooxygenase [Spongiibacter tropicus]|uniref:FAD-dependent monooxygenase n=1 Tax=Spongiibacter tropicus TaxID=454602 RepID=UPI0035BE2B24